MQARMQVILLVAALGRIRQRVHPFFFDGLFTMSLAILVNQRRTVKDSSDTSSLKKLLIEKNKKLTECDKLFLEALGTSMRSFIKLSVNPIGKVQRT